MATADPAIGARCSSYLLTRVSAVITVVHIQLLLRITTAIPTGRFRLAEAGVLHHSTCIPNMSLITATLSNTTADTHPWILQ